MQYRTVSTHVSLSCLNIFCMSKDNFTQWFNRFKTFPKQALVFTCLQYKYFENTVGRGEIARYEQFLLFPQRFLLVWRTFCYFNQALNCCLRTLSVWKSLEFVVWERLIGYFHLFIVATDCPSERKDTGRNY